MLFLRPNKSRHEEIHPTHCLLVVIVAALQRLCLLEVACDTQGRASDGASGEGRRQAIRQGQDRPLQASGEENQADDQAGQAPCRAYASPSSQQSLLLTLVERELGPFIGKKERPKTGLSRKIMPEAEKNRFEMIYFQMTENQKYKRNEYFLSKKKR